MGKLGVPALVGAVLFSGTTITWTTFHSSLYPYSISQPSSFNHYEIAVNPDLKADYFYPLVGSATTNVNITATPGREVPNETLYLRSLDGRNIRRTAWVNLAGQRVALMCADFQSVMGKYRIEQLSFLWGGMLWHVTMSYALRFKSMRSLMLRMLQSFKVRNPPPPPRGR